MLKIESELHTPVWGTEDWFKLDRPFEHLLFKVIDAREKLSVQVHPGDAYARVHENSLGKTEAWYILEAEEGAKLVYGFKEGVSKEDFRDAIENETVEELLNFVSVRPGDMFFIPAGVVHALGGGIKLAELQQNSNLTYRVWDYGRKPAREMHVEKALDVVLIDSDQLSAVSNRSMTCEYFSIEEKNISGEYTAPENCLIFMPLTNELFYANANERITGNGKILIMK